jgi:hypothetical protein
MPSSRGAATVFVLAAACMPAPLAWTTTPDDVAGYRAAFEAAAGTRLVARATVTELVARTANARVLWLGDHHRSARLHERQRRLLDALRGTGRPLLLVLEAVGEQDEPQVAAYLARDADERALRTAMLRRWPGSWLDDDGVDAPHYRELLRFARAHAVPVRALEPTPRRPMPERDAPIAARVRRLAAAHPEALVVVVVGQNHLLGDGALAARTGLPAVVVGGEPTPALRAAAAAAATAPNDGFVASDGGAWWFADLLRAP